MSDLFTLMKDTEYKLIVVFKMFEPNQGKIPGYTGHQKGVEEVDTGNRNKVA